MNNRAEKSILEMARGGFLERVDYEMAKILANIMDPNTKATGKRKLTITMELVPDDDRTLINVGFTAKSTLVPTNPVGTSLYITGDEATGEMCAVEMVPQIPGQYSMDGTEQERPARLKANEIRTKLDFPDTLPLHSLDALVKLVRTEAVHTETPLYITVPDHLSVLCFGQPQPDARHLRQVYYEARATDVPGWGEKVQLGFEEAQIALRTRFQETPDTIYAMKLLSDICCGAKVVYNDNGIATTVTTQKGVALQTNEQIRPIVKLKPYRTFQEVEQPESIFLIRVNDRTISFTEADGGMWKLTARQTVKAFLEDKLSDLVSAGDVFVAL